MVAEVLAATAGAAVLMGVLPRVLFALRLGRVEGPSLGSAMALLLVSGALAVFGAWAGSAAAIVANVAAMGACLGYLVQAERCQTIQAERRAVVDRARAIRARAVVARR